MNIWILKNNDKSSIFSTKELQKLTKNSEIGLNDYINRLRYFVGIKECKIPKLPKNIDFILSFRCDGKGNRLDSVELSEVFKTLMVNSKKDVLVSLDLDINSSELHANHPLLSDLEFKEITLFDDRLSPELMYMTMIEQIYRSFKIINNQTYHK